MVMKLVLIILFLMFVFTPFVRAERVVTDIPEQMNNVDGYITFCPPKETVEMKIEERLSDFFANYDKDDELYDFALNLENEIAKNKEFFDKYNDIKQANPGLNHCEILHLLGEENCQGEVFRSSFAEVFNDPKFDAFAKEVKWINQYRDKSQFYNLSKILNNQTARCIFQDGKYVSGGVTFNVEGFKAVGDSHSDQYILQEKGLSNLKHIKIPLLGSAVDNSVINITAERPFIKGLQIPFIDRDSIDFPVPLKDIGYPFFYLSSLNLPYYRLLTQPIFSMRINASSFRRDEQNFLNKKLNPNSEKNIYLYNQTMGKNQAADITANISRFTACSPELHYLGFCNLDPGGRLSVLHHEETGAGYTGNTFVYPDWTSNPKRGNTGTRGFKYGDPETTCTSELCDKNMIGSYDLSDTFSYSDKAGISFNYEVLKLQKKTDENGVPSASILFYASMPEPYKDVKAIGRLNFTKGTDLKEFTAQNYFYSSQTDKDLNFVEVSEDELADLLVNKYAFKFKFSNLYDVLSIGANPILTWDLPDVTNLHLKKSVDQGFKVYRNGELVATLTKDINSFEDTAYSSLEPSIYTYSVSAINSRGEETYIRTSCYGDYLNKEIPEVPSYKGSPNGEELIKYFKDTFSSSYNSNCIFKAN